MVMKTGTDTLGLVSAYPLKLISRRKHYTLPEIFHSCVLNMWFRKDVSGPGEKVSSII